MGRGVQIFSVGECLWVVLLILLTLLTRVSLYLAWCWQKDSEVLELTAQLGEVEQRFRRGISDLMQSMDSVVDEYKSLDERIAEYGNSAVQIGVRGFFLFRGKWRMVVVPSPSGVSRIHLCVQFVWMSCVSAPV